VVITSEIPDIKKTEDFLFVKPSVFRMACPECEILLKLNHLMSLTNKKLKSLIHVTGKLVTKSLLHFFFFLVAFFFATFFFAFFFFAIIVPFQLFESFLI